LSLREALGTGKLVMVIIVFLVIPEFLAIAFMYTSGIFHESGLIWISLAWLAAASFIAYTAMTMRFPSAVSETSVRISAPVEQISAVIPRIATENRWKLLQAEPNTGRFKLRIGMTFQTWSQTMLIRLSKIDEISTKVDIRCEALGQVYDYGRNQIVINRFRIELEHILFSQV
jgi:hypothetical protein